MATLTGRKLNKSLDDWRIPLVQGLQATYMHLTLMNDMTRLYKGNFREVSFCSSNTVGTLIFSNINTGGATHWDFTEGMGMDRGYNEVVYAYMEGDEVTSGQRLLIFKQYR